MTLRLLALAFAAAFTATAAAQTVINAVPYTITASGKYVLGNNLVTASSGQVAITINAPNVVLDLNEFFVSGPGGTPGSTTAVIFVGDVSNVTIRNGTIANNGYGVRFSIGSNNLNHVLENLNITRCYLAGILLSSTSPGTIIRNNTLTQIGNSSINSTCAAINTFGGTRIEGNTIHTVTETVSAIGIAAATGDFVVRNTIASATTGVFGGKYRDNLTVNCTTSVTQGIDAGGND